MVKKRELSHEERLTAKILREKAYSFPQITKVVECNYSTCVKVFDSFKNACLIHQKQETGRQRNST